MNRKIGYARLAADGRDLDEELESLTALGVSIDDIYTDRGWTGRSRPRPGLEEALRTCGAGDELVVTRLARLARSVADARDLIAGLSARQVALNLGGRSYGGPAGGSLAEVLTMVAGFEADLVRARTCEGLRVAKANGRLRGKKPKLSPDQETRLVEEHAAGERTVAEIAALFGVGRSTVYRAIDRARVGDPK